MKAEPLNKVLNAEWPYGDALFSFQYYSVIYMGFIQLLKE